MPVHQPPSVSSPGFSGFLCKAAGIHWIMVKSIILVQYTQMESSLLTVPFPCPALLSLWVLGGLSKSLQLSRNQLFCVTMTLLTSFLRVSFEFKGHNADKGFTHSVERFILKTKPRRYPLYRSNAHINIPGHSLSQILNSYFQLRGGVFYFDVLWRATLCMSQPDSVISVSLYWREPGARLSPGLGGWDAK